jgi:HPt (histidine-containing phosphotransfer) domain-containing protein
MPMNRHIRHRLRQAEPAAGHGAPPPVLDPATFERLRQLDPDGSRGFVGQVLRTYAASLERYLEAIAAARAAGELRPVGETAHTLKSSSAAVGALTFAACCAEVERLARAGDAAALGAPLDALLDEAARVRTAVRAMLPA